MSEYDDLVKRLLDTAFIGVPDFTNSPLMREAADAIQAQVKRINELERNYNMKFDYNRLGASTHVEIEDTIIQELKDSYNENAEEIVKSILDSYNENAEEIVKSILDTYIQKEIIKLRYRVAELAEALKDAIVNSMREEAARELFGEKK